MNAAAAQPKWRAERGGFLPTRVKRESLQQYEAEPGRFTRLFTLHDASLERHVGPKGLKVNQAAAIRSQAPALYLPALAGGKAQLDRFLAEARSSG